MPQGSFDYTYEEPTQRSIAVECWRVHCETCDDWDLFFTDPIGVALVCMNCHTAIRVV